MKRTLSAVTVAAAAVVMLAAPQGAAAQQADGWWEWALPALMEARGGSQGPVALPRGDRRNDDARNDRNARSLPDIILDRRDQGKGKAAKARNAKAGPPFCQNGQGHPVHGRQWCRDKGFGIGGGLINTRWETRGWEDVILRAPRGTDRRQGTLDRGGLIDILGDVIYGRVAAEGARQGASEPLNGRWLRTDGGATVLQIRSGSLPLAELTDVNGNGRVDAVLISGR